ncbi:MAG TPA: hypothetical protein PLZ08_08350 [Bacillota bacterium]|jgi:hypothetical protein|nr:hypothetical protein [Bacillota bacterium]HOL09956.1 hypothetical protein [Bacillota bacterium]HPO97954.1 hypothetical protein [Bacillota bacterium]
MKIVLAGLFSITIAFFGDRLLTFLKIPEPVRVGLLVPVVEELVKIYIALLLQLSPLYVSSIFGLGEGIIEVICSQNEPKPVLFWAAFLLHTILGLIYLSPLLLTFKISIAIIGHVLWNQGILYRNKSVK